MSTMKIAKGARKTPGPFANIEDAIAAFESARVPAGPVYKMRDTLEDPHVKAGAFFTEIDYPGIGKAPVAATPVKLHTTPGEVRSRPPQLGEHTAEILAELAEARPAPGAP